MMPRLFGIVGSELASKPGWYLVTPSALRVPVVGTSIKGTVLTAGQKVAVVQCFDDSMHEFGFSESNSGIDSLFFVGPGDRPQAIAANEAGACLYSLLHDAGVKRNSYRPATVTSVAADGLVATDRFTGRSAKWPVASGLSPSDFVVGDGVLVDAREGHEKILGWWQTVPGTWIDFSNNTFTSVLPHWFGLMLPTGSTVWEYWLRSFWIDFEYYSGGAPTPPASITLTVGSNTFHADLAHAGTHIIRFESTEISVRPAGLRWTVNALSPSVLYGNVYWFPVAASTSFSSGGYSVAKIHPFLLRRTVTP